MNSIFITEQELMKYSGPWILYQVKALEKRKLGFFVNATERHIYVCILILNNSTTEKKVVSYKFSIMVVESKVIFPTASPRYLLHNILCILFSATMLKGKNLSYCGISYN